MKYLICIFIAFSTFSCESQIKNEDIFTLSISPAIDQSNTENQKIIQILSNFLETKNTSLTQNQNWLESDFEKYIYPYKDIFKIERSKHGENYFKPTLMEIIKASENKKILKIGFVGTNTETEETTIIAIYNIVATRVETDWKLQRAIEFQTKDWTKINKESITYYLPERKRPNEKEMEMQKKDIEFICDFFNTNSIDIIYYSCDTPKQLFETKGFDYLPNMYFSETGGMVDYGNIIYSGNNSEYYTHEIVHIYTKKLFPSIQPILNEGIATYIGGSGKNNYDWHREKFKVYLNESEVEIANHLQPYERFYIDNETPIPYMIGALICERTLRKYGKEGLMNLLGSEKELWDNLNDYGLTKENLTNEIKTTANTVYN
ncbi:MULTISPECIES: hypothetical protein [Winogradskyella]|jgi:hypothetical protein|uniref:hypothetical protein n=1 Tax=Winogradskyella TaxID=286104 RepID=UPI0015C8BEB8|nr:MULTISPECIES: hypothetical protein [Winogradskyella]QXP78851.1 hypothetical protein H0I32_16845 [Winogradskyella sp. HaHa_3_26]